MTPELISKITLATLVVLLGITLVLWQTGKVIPFKKIFIWLLVIHLLSISTHAYFLYRSMAENVLQQFLLPPHSTFYYSQLFVIIRPFVAGWLTAGVLFGVLWYVFFRRGQRVFIDTNDLFFLTLGAAATGWPATFIFLAITFVIAVLLMIIFIILRRKNMNDRLIITPAIIPAAIITVIFKVQLLSLTGLLGIRF